MPDITAGPVGLVTAAQLLRIGLTVKIVDKASAALSVGRADAIQPRILEIMKQLGLIDEFLGSGPRIDHTIFYKDGKFMVFRRSHSSQSEFKFLQVISQPEIERILIRDIERFGCHIDRCTTLSGYYPVEHVDSAGIKRVNLRFHLDDGRDNRRAICDSTYLIGSDGAHSFVRASLSIPFDGIATGLVWQIVDCEWETNFPHAWVFGCVLNSTHGGVLIIPRENNMARLYVNVIPEDGQATVDRSKESVSTALERIRKVFHPYTIKPKGPIEWYTIWSINERVARDFCDPTNRIFLAGDAAHCHSAAGAYGLNTGIMDSQNLVWKLALDAYGIAKPNLLSSYQTERRFTALRIVEGSSQFLRFLCNQQSTSTFAKQFQFNEDEKFEAPVFVAENEPEGMDQDQAFFAWYAKTYTGLLTGMDVGYKPSLLNAWPAACKKQRADQIAETYLSSPMKDVCSEGSAIVPGHPMGNPLVFSQSRKRVQRLYDGFLPSPAFNIVIFIGSFSGLIRESVLDAVAHFARPESFRLKFTSQPIFKLHLVTTRCNSMDTHQCVTIPLGLTFQNNACQGDDPDSWISVYLDDKPEAESAHAFFGIESNDSLEQERVMVVRPDLWLGTKTTLSNFKQGLESYFDGFLHS